MKERYLEDDDLVVLSDQRVRVLGRGWEFKDVVLGGDVLWRIFCVCEI